MIREQDTARLHRKLADGLYTEAMVLADETRAYFDDAGQAYGQVLDPVVRVLLSCESLNVTTRLMHVIAWLLTQRALEEGELSLEDAQRPSRRLGISPETDAETLAKMPPQAAAIITASMDLYRRVARIDATMDMTLVIDSPARIMMRRIAAAF